MADAVRLFSTFQFSEAHEIPLVLAKLSIESPLIEKWIIVENSFTHKGQLKRNELVALLDADRRFDQFRDRIEVISLDENFVSRYPHSWRDRMKLVGKHLLPSYDNEQAKAVFEERPFWYAEQRQRDSALDAIFEASGGEGWVLVADADEFVDCSTQWRRDQIVDSLRSGAAVIRLRRQRFNYDIDNFCPAVRFVGCAAVRYLRETGVGLQTIRLRSDGFLPTLQALVFEYSYCYSRTHIDRKLASYIHQDPGASVVDLALECNHGFFISTPLRIDHEMWYQTVELDAVGTPEYVLEHAEQLRTGNINPGYADARARTYPHLFGWQRGG